jgi:6-phosphogluconolactonase
MSDANQTTSEISVYEARDDLIEAVCEASVTVMERSMLETGWCMWALSGGSTPRGVLQRLATEPYRSRIVWNRLHLFWGDEREVSPDHPESNYRMVREALIDRVDIPEVNIHRIEAELGADEAATRYESELARLFDESPPRFDLVWLGMGDDGHTASLFPGTGAVELTDRNVAATYTRSEVSRAEEVGTTYAAGNSVRRVSLTLPVLNAARDVMVLVAGDDKASMLQRVMGTEQPTPDLPVSMVRPVDGTVRWFVDRAAAGQLGQ